MMIRYGSGFLAVLALVAFPSLGAAQGNTLELNKPFTGELGGKEIPASNVNGDLPQRKGYGALLPVELNAGQKVDIVLEVKGVNRNAFVVLIDKTGKIVDKTTFNGQPGDKVTLMIPAVNVTGRYQILVFSDKVGEFVLEAQTEPKKALTVKDVERQIADLEKQLKDLKIKLEALKKAEQSKP